MNFVIVLSTAGKLEEAEKIAEELVAKKLAACVNIIPAIHSIYRWNNAVQKDKEVLMIIKTERGKFEMVESTIRSLHSYDVPEVISFPLEDGSQGYLQWLESSLNS